MTQGTGEPRYPSLRAIMAARTKPIVSLGLSDIGLSSATVGGSRAQTRVIEAVATPPRPPTRVVKGTPAEAARCIVEFLINRGVIS
jgi:electron transfer flavoprotein beta subunit